jgi:hypothetical protein
MGNAFTDLVVKRRIEGKFKDTFGSRLGAAVRQKPLRIFSSDFEETTPASGVLRDWTTAHTGTASHTVAASARQDGGNTLTLVDADTAGLALVRSKAFHGYANRPQWFTTDEMTCPTGQTIRFEIQASTLSRRGYIEVNSAGAGTIRINSDDGLGAVTVPNVSTAIGLTSTTAFRLGMWYDPRSGKVRFYLFCGTGAGIRHIYMGERNNPNAPLPISYIQLNTGHPNTGNVTAARVEAFEVRGIIHGASTDLPNNAFDTSPAAYPTQSRYNDSAVALAQRLWGQREGIVNMAHGTWAYSHMYGGGLSANGEDTATWTNMVTALKPQFVVIGSAINSLAQITVGSTTMANVKATLKLMIDESLAAGASFVVIRNCSPVGGHVTFNTSEKLDLVDEWNEYLTTIPGLYPDGQIVISDAYGEMNDPANDRHMLARYDVGDHIHYSVAGAEALADADAKAILGSI